MHVPELFTIDDPSLQRELLRDIGFGRLVTAAGRLDATPLPFVVDDDLSRLRGHLARANPHWRDIDGTDALFLVSIADAYVSPRWYPSKAETAEVVPTWNYVEIHLRGTVRTHHDPAWLRRVVTELTDRFEAGVAAGVGDGGDPGEPWQVDDAPPAYIERMLAAIVGVELIVEEITAKAKLSQNRPERDRSAVTTTLAASPTPRNRIVGRLMTDLAGGV